ncbi:Hypothetical Protein FCC1311_110402 [Hondaea fermentalgiana]|uniref:Uncharacterized protein n=1 Tax=Hondaea fermentalgiana TaxID=2315210 RepID=A0A2R5GYD3_9STRA|nr:Hypothetical Protein FCC1311_110402 [Hondaea fermentalgiana]|eukprot:GBG34818.1 Hypothetical Protein FCC1311_110402 [Hondaea fermentalgiana]
MTFGTPSTSSGPNVAQKSDAVKKEPSAHATSENPRQDQELAGRNFQLLRQNKYDFLASFGANANATANAAGAPRAGQGLPVPAPATSAATALESFSQPNLVSFLPPHLQAALQSSSTTPNMLLETMRAFQQQQEQQQQQQQQRQTQLQEQTRSVSHDSTSQLVKNASAGSNQENSARKRPRAPSASSDGSLSKAQKRDNGSDAPSACSSPAAVALGNIAPAKSCQGPVRDIEFCNVHEWKASYVRTRHKNLRCFPACLARHMENGFCGQSVCAHLYMLDRSAVDALGLELYAGIRKASSPLLYEAGQTVGKLFKEDPISRNKVFRGEWKSFEPSAGRWLVEFIAERRWRYLCKLAKHTMKQEHVFTIYVVSRKTMTCVAHADSPAFRLTSAWKQPGAPTPAAAAAEAAAANAAANRVYPHQAGGTASSLSLDRLPAGTLEYLRQLEPSAARAAVQLLLRDNASFSQGDMNWYGSSGPSTRSSFSSAALAPSLSSIQGNLGTDLRFIINNNSNCISNNSHSGSCNNNNNNNNNSTVPPLERLLTML